VAENNNIAIKNRFVAAVLANDTWTIAELTDPGFELLQSLDLPYGGTYNGPEGFIEFLQRFSATYEIEVLREVGAYQSHDPDLLVFEFEFKATLLNSGQPFATSILESWQFKDHRVFRIKPHYFNVPARLTV
jgi:hypothetical protein